MLPTLGVLHAQLRLALSSKQEQGHETEGLDAELAALPDSYDALARFAEKLAHLPLRSDWGYDEPSELDAIWAACDPSRPRGAVAPIDAGEAAGRVETAFLASVCGCMLGKPLEFNPTLEEIRAALEPLGEWPLRDYIPEAARIPPRPGHLPRPAGAFAASWPGTVRERIRHAVPDDDINYTILGMLVLEQTGLGFSGRDLVDLWLRHLPVRYTFGPERVLLIKAALDSLEGGGVDEPASWSDVLQPCDELCGAMIRADAYGYACPGRPALAAELAWRDARMTHRRNGIYGAMFAAAAIAIAPVMRAPLEVFATALEFVPRRSRFHAIVSDCLEEVSRAADWLDGYHRIHHKYARYDHCRVFQETGTLINTLRFAEDIGDGICKQVSQGNDTDSYGATAGSLLGVFFGPGHLEERWLRPLNDDIRTALAGFEERSLHRLARRMGELPRRIAEEIASTAG